MQPPRNQAPGSIEQLQNNAQQQRRREQQLAMKHKRIEQTLKLIEFLQQNGLKMKEATANGKLVEYFRVDEYEQLVANKKLFRGHSDLLKTRKQAQKRLKYYDRPAYLPHLKYPKNLQKVQEKQVRGKFASFGVQKVEEQNRLFLPLVLMALLVVVLFPIWPYTMKYVLFLAVWYLLLGLLILIAVRLMLYLFAAIFGYSLWLFPRLNENCGVVASFTPVFGVHSWETSIYSVIGRLIALSIVLYYGVHMYLDPSFVYKNMSLTQAASDELYDWGIAKIKGENNFSQSALTDINSIINQTNEDEEHEQLENAEGYEQLDAEEEQLDAEEEQHVSQDQQERKQTQQL